MLSLKPTQKYGRPNEATPAKWNADYKDFHAPLENGVSAPPKAVAEKLSPEKTSPEDVAVAPSMPPADATEEPAIENGEAKKRKRAEDETPEQKAERKRKKKEKKEKKEKRKSKGKEEEASD